MQTETKHPLCYCSSLPNTKCDFCTRTRYAVQSKATKQLFEVLGVEWIKDAPLTALYHLKPVAPIVNKAYADRYKFWGEICLGADELDAV